MALRSCGTPRRPELGITVTPVIDTNTMTLVAVLAETKENGTLVYRLHALDVTTGDDLSNVVVQASVPGIGNTDSLGLLTLTPVNYLARPGFSLGQWRYYLSFGSMEAGNPTTAGS